MEKLLNQIINDQQRSLDSTLDNLDMQQYICFTSSENNYFCKIHEIKEILEPIYIARFPVIKDHFIGIINVRGRIIPVIHEKKISIDKIDELNQGLLNQDYRLLVFEIDQKQQYALLVHHVFKKSSDKKDIEIISVNQNPYVLFNYSQFAEIK